jgi:hypothetical protein
MGYLEVYPAKGTRRSSVILPVMTGTRKAGKQTWSFYALVADVASSLNGRPVMRCTRHDVSLSARRVTRITSACVTSRITFDDRVLALLWSHKGFWGFCLLRALKPSLSQCLKIWWYFAL